jgi:uncharacterized SAM-binding protein YcdF (DUF218 family)
VFFLKPLARSLALPPACCLILILIGAILIRRRRRFGWPLFTVGFASLWLFCTPLVADGLKALAEGYPALNPDKPVSAQAVVVLGGGTERIDAPEYNGSIADNILLERVTLGAFLAKRFALPLAVTGSAGEATAMSETLARSFGVTPRWIDGRSRDTYENAQMTARMLFPEKIKRIVLVTSSTHEWRAAHEFMDLGFDVLPAPVGVSVPHRFGIFEFVPGIGALTRSNVAMYELMGEPVRRLLGALHLRERFDRNVPVAPAH